MAEINTREIVLAILLQVTEEGRYSHLVINGTLDKYMYLEKQDRTFIKRVSEGTMENLIRIDYVIDLYSNTKVVKMKPEIRNILRLSVYQILFMDAVPDYSVCNEAVKLTLATKKYRNLKGFVNGVLRTICRERDHISYPDAATEYSIPEWICNQWENQYGKDISDVMIRSQNEPSPLTIRPGYKTSLSELKDILGQEGVNYCKAPYIEDALEISGFDNLINLKSFVNGRFYIQDISSMLVGLVAAPKKGDFCLDVCAAPGGKSLHLATLMDNTGRVIARDKSDYKVSLLNENFKRSGLSNISAECFDATVYDASMDSMADILICDLPCSGLGVIRRKPDIRYKMNVKMQQDLIRLQREIISTVYKYVKVNGKLIYSTCTTNLEENIENVKWLTDHLPFHTESINMELPEELRCDSGEEGYIQLISGVNKCDSFFICKLLRDS